MSGESAQYPGLANLPCSADNQRLTPGTLLPFKQSLHYVSFYLHISNSSHFSNMFCANAHIFPTCLVRKCAKLPTTNVLNETSSQSFSEELPQRKVRYAIFVTFRQKRSGADYIFGMIILYFLQRTEFPITC